MDLLQEVYNVVKTIDDKVDQILQWKAAHIERHESVERDVNEVRDSLYGTDRKNGLLSRVQGLQGCKETIKDKARDRRQFVLGVLSKVLAVGIVALVTWLLVKFGG